MAQGTLNDDFEEELTETEMRRLNQEHLNETQDMDDLMKPVGIHRLNQDHAMPDHSIADPTMFAQHLGMMPMSNRMIPGAMPYPGQLQSLYGPQMYPGDPAFARFNLNELAYGGAQEMQTANATGIATVATKGKAISFFLSSLLLHPFFLILERLSLSL